MAIQTADTSLEHRTTAGLLQVAPEELRANYNRAPFTFAHRLSEHPLMQLEALIDLANRLPADQVRHSRGKRGFEVDGDDDLRHLRHKLSLDQVLQDMNNADAYVMLYRPDTDPEYRELLFDALGDVRPLVEPMDPGMFDEAAYIFIASPGAVTPYHMDREVNFLCQVSGTKVVRLWDQDDRSILSDDQIDTFFAREDLPKPGYKPEYDKKAMIFTLTPGTGVHQPLLAPHAVINGDEISIAIALTFRSTATRRRSTTHKANYALRRLGLHPARYGASPALDGVKYNGYRAFRALKSRLRTLGR